MKSNIIIAVGALLLTSCFRAQTPLEQALEIAGENRAELERVIAHYDNTGDTEKQRATKYLIENMPGHFSYSTNRIDDYYGIALDLARSGMPPKEQYDSLLYLSQHEFADLPRQSVQDIKVIKAD